MSYIPLYPHSHNAVSHPSIWSPNQPRKLGSPTNLWPRMPTGNISDPPISSVHDSFTTGNNISKTSDHNVLEDKETQDVFGPVMHNDPKATQALDVKKDVGAIGDRRKKDDGCKGIADVHDTSDACSTVSSRLVYYVSLPALTAWTPCSSLSVNCYAPLRSHPPYRQSLCFVIPRPAES